MFSSLASISFLFSVISYALSLPTTPAISASARSPTLERRQASPIQTDLNNLLHAILDQAPLVNGAINDVVGVLTNIESLISVTTKTPTTYNEFDESGTCKNYTFLFARGTTEPGNVGILTGPAVIDALKNQSAIGVDGLTVQGINNYTATINEYLAGGDEKGIYTMYVEFHFHCCTFALTQFAIC